MLVQFIYGIIIAIIIYVFAGFVIPILRFISESDGLFDLYENDLREFLEVNISNEEIGDSNKEKLTEIKEMLEEIEDMINDLIDFYDECEIMYLLDNYEFKGLTLFQRKIKLANILYQIRMWQWYNKEDES